MAILTKPKADGAHWYSGNGEPVHTRPSSAGGTRFTTLKDARELGLFPSVTSILNVLAKPGLEKWKIQQVLLAMKRNPQKKEEAEEPYFNRVINDAFDQVDKASHAGTGLHGAVMAALQGRGIDPQYKPYIEPIFAFFERAKIEPRTTEQTVVNWDEGFAGTMDFGGIRDGVCPVVLDWKTRRTKPGQPITAYEGQPMQIAAYAATYWKNEFPLVIGGNIYISSTEPGRIEFIPYDGPRLKAEYDTFLACCRIWRHLNGYDPRTAGSAVDKGAVELLQDRWRNVVISSPVEGAPSLVEIAEAAKTTQAPKVAPPVIKKDEPKPEAIPANAPVSPVKPSPPAKKEKKAPPPHPKATAEDPVSQAKFPKKGEKVEKGDPNKPALPTIPFGKFRGTEVHNVPREELEKMQKFCKPQLAANPEVAFAIKRFLEASAPR